MTDKALHRLTVLAMLAVAIIAAVVSFVHIFSLAYDHHQLDYLSALYPFAIDGLIVVMSVTLYRVAQAREMSKPRWAWPLLWLGILATLAANFAYGIPYGWLSAVISCWPAVAFVGCVEVVVEMAKRTAVKPAPKAKEFVQPKIEVSVSGNGHGTPQRVRKRKAKRPSMDAATAERLALQHNVSVTTVRRNREHYLSLEAAN